MAIEEKEIEYDIAGRIDVTQPSCVSCRQREKCQELYDHIKNENLSNEIQKTIRLLKLKCEKYDSMAIQFPIEVEGITADNNFIMNTSDDKGKFVIAHVLLRDYDDDLHFGIHLGLLPATIISTYDLDSKFVHNSFAQIPAVFIPHYNKIFYSSQIQWTFVRGREVEVIPDDDCLIAKAVKEYFFNKAGGLDENGYK